MEHVFLQGSELCPVVMTIGHLAFLFWHGLDFLSYMSGLSVWNDAPRIVSVVVIVLVGGRALNENTYTLAPMIYWSRVSLLRVHNYPSCKVNSFNWNCIAICLCHFSKQRMWSMSAPCKIDEKSAIMHVHRVNVTQKKIEKAFGFMKTYYNIIHTVFLLL